MKISYLGNFGPQFSTENHVALSLESLGHTVTRLQEGVVKARKVAHRVKGHDLFLWTQTQSLADAGGSRAERAEMLATVREMGIPSAGFHLDRWWGLDRETQVIREPFFRVDRLFTADGGHDDDWQRVGIDHTWSPPAVYHGEAVDVPSSQNLDVIFVGSWKRYGHAEWWPYRKELLERLSRRYGRRFTCWPRAGDSVRGLELNALYASAKVVIGDSCLAGTTRYWSDRIPETLGRGGFLLHPFVEGFEGYTDGEHLRLWELGNWKELFALVDYYLSHDAARERIRAQGAAHVRAHHTYRDRMRAVVT